MSDRDSAFMRILDADLPPATERIALRLAARAEWTPSGYGLVTLSWQAFATLCKRTNRSSARRHLTALARTGFICYDGRGQGERADLLQITWLPEADLGYLEEPDAGAEWAEACDPAYALDAAQPTEWARERATAGASAHPPRRAGAPHACPEARDMRAAPRAVQCAQHTEGARPRAAHGAPSRPLSHACAVVGGGQIFSHPQEDPVTTTNHPPAISEQLRAVGLRPCVTPIHRDLCADDVRRILDAWQQDAAAQEVGAGALLYRLRYGITPVDLPAARDPERAKYEIPPEYAGIIIG